MLYSLVMYMVALCPAYGVAECQGMNVGDTVIVYNTRDVLVPNMTEEDCLIGLEIAFDNPPEKHGFTDLAVEFFCEPEK